MTGGRATLDQRGNADPNRTSPVRGLTMRATRRPGLPIDFMKLSLPKNTLNFAPVFASLRTRVMIVPSGGRLSSLGASPSCFAASMWPQPCGWGSRAADATPHTAASGRLRRREMVRVNALDPSRHFFCDAGPCAGVHGIADSRPVLGFVSKSSMGGIAKPLWTNIYSPPKYRVVCSGSRQPSD
jgi:hypothetical protein